MNNSFRMILKATIDNEEQEFEFDVVEDTTINASSTLTSHPLVNGDITADHMYRNQTTVSMSGIFSLSGNQPTAYTGSYSDRLTNIEHIFERIKNEGIMCTLQKLNRSDDATVRFKERNNMVLTSIVWIELQNALKFSFSFTEAILIDVEEEYNENADDIYIPSFAEPSVRDFTDTFIDWSQIENKLLEELQRNVYSTEELNTIISTSATMSSNSGIIQKGLTSLAKGAISTFVSSDNEKVNSVVDNVSNIIASAISSIFNNFPAIKTINTASKGVKIIANNASKAEQETLKVAKLFGEVQSQIEYLEKDIKVYGIAKNEEQDNVITIDDSYYTFTFTKNTITAKVSPIKTNKIIRVSSSNSFVNYSYFPIYTYSLTIRDADGDVIKQIPTLTALSNISQCSKSNYVFKVNNTTVYVFNTKLYASEKNNMTQTDIDYTILNDLRNYVILVTSLDMSTFNEQISIIIQNAIKNAK